ncbi:thiamine-phosphate kinase [Ornithinibacillus californiensis]|uniref:thiamine-phosphate kinase n=1 Tax=Ornithinibacillus californiensis TaxID=161536 RepID=UPI00064DD689|nr:thiamine-phosphate kinase [Ornithinibacillus californiensis]
MDEFSFINSIQQSYYRQSSLLKGIGDDAAVIRSNNQDIVIAKDMFVENVHFNKETMTPYHIGYKALAANLSDMAAMRAKPAFYLVGISISDNWSTDDLNEIYEGMQSLANQYNVDLIGGDTVSGSELVISITVLGFTNKDNASLRSLAQEGDIIFATGTLGDSQAGLHMLFHPDNYKDEKYFKRRHQMPSPRVDFALGLQSISRVALNDISDGIASEAHEIAEASNVSIVLQDEKLPIHPYLSQFDTDLQYKWKLFGGEDYELLGTVSKREWETVKQVASQQNVRVTEIGYVTAVQPVSRVLFQQKNGKMVRLEKKGYNHLSR